MSGHRTPEEAVIAEDSVPLQYVRVVAVDYSPSGDHAVVLLEYSEPPAVEPYVTLCEKTCGGWVTALGGSGGGQSWMATDRDAVVGVEVTWGLEPTVTWNVPSRDAPERPPSGGR